MKKIIISVITLIVITLFLTLGPYNLIHYLNAEKMVIESGVFLHDESDIDSSRYYGRVSDINEVEYLGRNTFLVTYNSDDGEVRLTLRINKISKYGVETDVFKYKHTMGRFGTN